jgi:SprB repeat
MLTKNLSGFIAIVSWASLFFYMSCSSSDEPGPVDCTTSNLAVSFTSSDPKSCGTSDGSITASATGGDAPYQFALDAQAFAATASFTGLGAGTYQLKLKDKNGCERTTAVILKPFGSTLAATVQLTDSGCKTSNGAITINATGGTGPYSYKLNDGTASASNIFGSLAAGSYSVRVTDNAGCSITQTVKVLNGISFAAEVKNIIDTNCAVSGCHVSGGAAPGSFTSMANIQSSASEIKSRTQSGNMPKNGTKLPQAQLDAIACWVDDGALNN